MPEAAAKRIKGIEVSTLATFTFDGAPVSGFVGESLAAALLRAGYAATRLTQKRREQRGYYCGMGVCWECVVLVAGVGQVRACLCPVRNNMIVQRAPLAEWK
jgi:2Fe-2S iron-sulfur cluster binding domain